MRGGPFVRAIALRTAIGATAMSGAGYTAQYRDLRGTLPTNGEYPLRDMERVDAVVIHHTATQGQTLRTMAEFHVERRGWQGIGYHYAVGYDGTIYYLNDAERRTNHTAGNNSRTIGIALVGNMERNPMPAAQRSSLIALVYYLREIYGTTYIHPHCHYSPTLCPGKGTHDAVGHLWDGTLNCKR